MNKIARAIIAIENKNAQWESTEIQSNFLLLHIQILILHLYIFFIFDENIGLSFEDE
jgi:hypothetical protein